MITYPVTYPYACSEESGCKAPKKCCKKDSAVFAVIGALAFFLLVNKKQKKRLLQQTTTPIPTPVPPPLPTKGSIFFGYPGFDSTLFSYVSNPNAVSFTIGTNDFTIEWFQFWQKDPNPLSSPKVFSIGSFANDSVSLSISYEATETFFRYADVASGPFSPSQLNFGVGVQPPVDQWVHMALVGVNSTNSITLYINGVGTSGTLPITPYNIANDASLVFAIGNESSPTPEGNFAGNITNFRFVNGTAVYTSNFTPPTSPLNLIPGTQVLLLTENPTNYLLNSEAGLDVTSYNNISYSTSSPFV
jgi:hypothetical protein